MTARTDAHPSDSTLQGFALGKLRDSAADRLIEHLDGCPDCRERAAALPDGTLDMRKGAAPDPAAAPASDLAQSRGCASAAPVPNPDPAPAPNTPSAFPSKPIRESRLPPDVPPELAEHTGYEIVKELGRGGMGVVYLARNLLMDRLEVLKVMNKAQVGRPEAIERFIQEIRSAALLNHPNVATAYSAHLIGEQLVLAMEYVEGDDLGKIVKKRGPLPIPFSCFCAREAALGLQRGHELGLVHRDIKPSNLILCRQGKRSFVKIVDFGLAKAKAETPADRGLTATNQMMGTLGFTAPEQLRDARSADTRADIYSLGCTLYCLLTGATPFQGNSAYEVFIAQESGGVRPLRTVRPEVPAEVAEIVAKMMSKEAGRPLPAAVGSGRSAAPLPQCPVEDGARRGQRARPAAGSGRRADVGRGRSRHESGHHREANPADHGRQVGKDSRHPGARPTHGRSRHEGAGSSRTADNGRRSLEAN